MGFVALVYSLIAYLLFFAAFLYLIAFMGGDMTSFFRAPKTIDAGAARAAVAPAALINIVLLLAFGLQHTIMARQGFKKALTRLVPWPMERSTYVLATVVMLVLLYLYWRPMPGVVWHMEGVWASAMTALYFIGIALVLISTLLINHFELFGLQQGWIRFRGEEQPKPEFRTPSLYQHIRHPLYLGWITAFWATSHMTVGHLLFAAVWTIYIFVAVGYEERDLVAVFGEKYRDYMARVPAILPFGGKK